MGFETHKHINEGEEKKIASKMEGKQTHYSEKASVNGVDFSVSWDNGYKDYTIYFPQIELGEKAYEQGVSEQELRISKDPEIAQKVFDFVNQEAQQENDVYKLYKKVGEFIRSLR